MFAFFCKDYRLIRGERRVIREIKNKIKKTKTIKMGPGNISESYILDTCVVSFNEKIPEFKVIDDEFDIEIVSFDCHWGNGIRVFRYEWFYYLLNMARARNNKEIKKQEKLQNKQKKAEDSKKLLKKRKAEQNNMFYIAQKIRGL